ncbi:Hypothetical predicted protein [Cloeon dipterum]|uniref:PDZ domain-containing protein n=1 Tax=Cloeon dipterum TaxID=197152 RepID=A0A8S1CRG5_9INSE|nr:Hypothetical predicted protein [Cloeon dipterum]
MLLLLALLAFLGGADAKFSDRFWPLVDEVDGHLAANFRNVSEAVLLVGGSGTGKTSLAMLLASDPSLRTERSPSGLLLSDGGRKIGKPTFLPHFMRDDESGVVLVDCPSPAEPEEEVAAAEYAVMRTVSLVPKVKVLVVENVYSFLEGGDREGLVRIKKLIARFGDVAAVVAAKSDIIGTVYAKKVNAQEHKYLKNRKHFADELLQDFTTFDSFVMSLAALDLPPRPRLLGLPLLDWMKHDLDAVFSDTLKFDDWSVENGIVAAAPFVLLSEVVKKYEGRHKPIVMMASQIIFLDRNISLQNGEDLIMIAPEVQVVNKNVTIELTGQVGWTRVDAPLRGDGQAGGPGGNSGNLLIFCTKLVNAERLSIRSQGGDGGMGQEGGPAAQGRQQLEKTVEHLNISSFSLSGKTQLEISESVFEPIAAGAGGVGGHGGFAGSVLIYSSTGESKKVRVESKRGADGQAGPGGKGARAEPKFTLSIAECAEERDQSCEKIAAGQSVEMTSALETGAAGESDAQAEKPLEPAPFVIRPYLYLYVGTILSKNLRAEEEKGVVEMVQRLPDVIREQGGKIEAGLEQLEAEWAVMETEKEEMRQTLGRHLPLMHHLLLAYAEQAPGGRQLSELIKQKKCAAYSAVFPGHGAAAALLPPTVLCFSVCPVSVATSRGRSVVSSQVLRTRDGQNRGHNPFVQPSNSTDRRMRFFGRRHSEASLSSSDKEQDNWQMVKAVPAFVLEDTSPQKKGTMLSTWGRRVGRKLELLRRPETPSSRSASGAPPTQLFRSCSTSQLSYVRGDDPAEDLIQPPPPTTPSKTLSCDNLSQIGRRFPYAFLRSSKLAALPEEPGMRQFPRCRPHSITSFEVPSTESGYDSDRPSSEESNSNSGGRSRASLCEPRVIERCAPRFGSYRVPCRPPNGPDLKMIRLQRASGMRPLGIHAAPRRLLQVSSQVAVGDGFFVKALDYGSVAKNDGRLMIGDEIVSVNGAVLRGLPVTDVQRILADTSSTKVRIENSTNLFPFDRFLKERTPIFPKKIKFFYYFLQFEIFFYSRTLSTLSAWCKKCQFSGKKLASCIRSRQQMAQP